MKIKVKAPSNIALIKYMGKSDESLNLPANPSLSMTLDSLATYVEMEYRPSEGADLWKWTWSSQSPHEGVIAAELSEAGRKRGEKHLERLVAAAEGTSKTVPGEVVIKTGNTFPQAVGIASSASSFAAFTLAFSKILDADFKDLSVWSRQGSGSSCRSFQGPWVAWEKESSLPVVSRLPPLVDLVVLISGREKEVSSSEAHRRVKTSPIWHGRVERATRRFEEIKAALGVGDLERVAFIAWQETMEMHSLFHTSEPGWSYWEQKTVEVLNWLEGQDVIVTLDAGPNVHVLVREADHEEWLKEFRARFGDELPVLVDRQGRGAAVL